MTGFKPGSSGIGSDWSVNCATTTARNLYDLGKNECDQMDILFLQYYSFQT